MTLGTYTHAFAGYGERNAARSATIFAGVFASSEPEAVESSL